MQPRDICECGRPAATGAAAVRCCDCGRPLCAACAAPDEEGPIDICYRCALEEAAAEQGRLMRAIGLTEITRPALLPGFVGGAPGAYGRGSR